MNNRNRRNNNKRETNNFGSVKDGGDKPAATIEQAPAEKIPEVKPSVPEPADVPESMQSLDSSMNGDEGASNDGSTAPKLRRFTKKSRVSKFQKKIKQNRRLRKLLTPKTALMALNELKGSLVQCNITGNGQSFNAEVFINGKVYEGFGNSKIAAKNNASEKALREFVIQKMAKKPKAAPVQARKERSSNNGLNSSPSGNATAAGNATASGNATSAGNAAASENATAAANATASDNEDVEMKDANEDEEDEVPMMHLASFALHKLFTEWEAQGFRIPDLRCHNLSGPAPDDSANDSSGNGEGKKSGKQPLPGKTELPPNHETMHPCMLLSYMRPSVAYSEFSCEGTPPAEIVHRVGVTVDGKHYMGSGRSKKIARKSAAINACNDVFKTKFVDEVLVTPKVEIIPAQPMEAN